MRYYKESWWSSLSLSMDDVADSYNVTRNIISRFCDYFSIAPFHCTCKMWSTYRGIKFESAVWRLEEKKLKICQHLLTSCTLMKNRSFEVVDKGENGRKCTKMKNARVKRVCQICKFVTFSCDRLTSLGNLRSYDGNCNENVTLSLVSISLYLSCLSYEKNS